MSTVTKGGYTPEEGGGTGVAIPLTIGGPATFAVAAGAVGVAGRGGVSGPTSSA